MSTMLQNTVGGLSAAEKFELLDLLCESLEAELPLFMTEQNDELDRRVAKYKQNPADVVPWEQVKARILKKV